MDFNERELLVWANINAEEIILRDIARLLKTGIELKLVTSDLDAILNLSNFNSNYSHLTDTICSMGKEIKEMIITDQDELKHGIDNCRFVPKICLSGSCMRKEYNYCSKCMSNLRCYECKWESYNPPNHTEERTMWNGLRVIQCCDTCREKYL